MTHPDIDLSKFVKNERANEWRVVMTITGTIVETVEADSEAEAREKAFRLIESGDIEVYSNDDGIMVSVDRVMRERPMYLVRRGSEKMQTTDPQPGDEPRQPDERGF